MADERDIAAYYDRGDEQGRLGDWGRLEFLRTRELLARFLPAPPATVLDVGGAAGAYALPLAAEGYEVHLVDPVALHVEQARAASAAQPDAPLASAVVGDARALPVDDHSADVVLLLGPLYHLTEAADRTRALHEARRALRPGGLLAAAAITRFASTLDGVAQGFLLEPGFEAIVERSTPARPRRGGRHGSLAVEVDAAPARPVALASQARAASAARPVASAVVGDAASCPSTTRAPTSSLMLGAAATTCTEAGRPRAAPCARRGARCAPAGCSPPSAITRFASTLDGIAQGFLLEPGFEEFVERDLADGQHRNPGAHPRWFTTAYFHRPGRARARGRGAPASTSPRSLAIEGAVGAAAETRALDAWLDDPGRREVLLRADPARGGRAEPARREPPRAGVVATRP